MDIHGVVPDVIDASPANSITIKYDSGVDVNQGNELTPTQVQNQPTHFEYPNDPNYLYTVLFVDPDGPSRAEPKYREFVHWLVVNVPGNDLSKGKTISHFVGSGPPKDSGLHRYVFFVFKQPGEIDPSNDGLSTREGRMCFKTRNFAAKYNLGNPVAGNLYQAQYDDYVPILHARYAAASQK